MSLLETFKHTKKFAQKNSALRNLYHWFNKGERLISRDAFFKNKSSEASINIANKNFLYTYNKLVPETNFNIDENIPSVIGWVPYIKNRTNVFLFHFFSINYGLRKNLLTRISLIKGLNVIKQNCFWFPIFGIHEIDLINLWNDLDGDAVYVEMFHPKISKTHGDSDGNQFSLHRFHGKYYNKNKRNTCTVHSMPIDKKSKFFKKAIYGRKQVSVYDYEKNFHFSRSYRVNVQANDNKEIKTHHGYNMITDKDMNPLSIWHQSSNPVKSIRAEDDNTKKDLQGFWCPPTSLLDPLLFIDQLETELISNTINFYLINGLNIKKKKTINVKGSFSMKVSEIFGEKIPGPYIVLCEFSYNQHGYLNVCYNGLKSTGDCVHSWRCNWKIDGDKISPISKKRAEVVENSPAFSLMNTRKFFNFKKKENENEFNYYLVHINKTENNINNTNTKFALRLLLDNGNEYIKTINVNFKEPIQVFDIDNLFNLKDKENFKYGIVQLESIYTNFFAHLLRFDSDTGIVAIDHFTGA